MVASCCVLLAVALAQGTQSCANAETRAGATGSWTIVQGPSFPEGESQISSLAVDASNPERQYVTNGRVVMRSLDGGCGWEKAFALPASASVDEPLADGNGTIRNVVARGGRVVANVTGPTSEPTVMLNGREYPGDTVTMVYSSGDAGATWGPSEPIVEPTGGNGPLAQAPSDPKVVYLATGQQMHRSDDGGRTFRRLDQMVTDEVIATSRLQEIAVDPRSSQTLIVRGDFSVWRSTNGGTTFTPYGGPQNEGPASPYLVGPSFGRDGRVVFSDGDRDDFEQMRGENRAWVVSDDGGAGFTRRTPEEFGRVTGLVNTLAAGASSKDLLVTTRAAAGRGDSDVYRWKPDAGRLVGVDEFGLAPLAGSQFEDGSEPRAFFHNGRQIIAWKTPPGGTGFLPGTPPVTVRPPVTDVPVDGKEPPQPEDRPKGPPAILTPAEGDVRVEPGSSTLVDYRLEIPRRPSRLDAFYLVDSSGSTRPYIERLGKNFQTLSDKLVARGVDGWFGLGEYQDVESGSNPGTRYRRRSDLRPPGAYLKSRFDSINTNGGNEPGYTALHQVATGSGIEEPSRGLPVKPNQQANWRQGTVRLIVHAADEPFSEDPDGPTPAQTYDALRERNIRFVGLAVLDAPVPVGQQLTDCGPVQDTGLPDSQQLNAVGGPLLLCQMQKVARETGSLAPQGGVDCNGDGVTDVLEGQPLVCVVTDGQLVDVSAIDVAVERLVLTFPLAESVLLATKDAQPPVGVEITPGGDYSKVDTRVGAVSAFAVRFSCAADQAGKVFDVPLEGRLRDLPIAEAKPRVICGEAAPAAVPPVKSPKAPAEDPASSPRPDPVQAFAPVTQQAPVVAPVPLIPPPPAPVPASAPAPSTAQANSPAQASSTSAAQASSPATSPGSVSATAREQEEELVFQTVRVEDVPGGEEEQLNFSRNPDNDQLPWLMRTLGFAGVLGAGALAARRRQLTRTRMTRKAYDR